MDINQYNIYSNLSISEKTNIETQENILGEIKKIETFDTIKSVKEYLKETYNVDDSTRQFYLENNIPVKIDENSETYMVSISVKNERFMYYYKKGEN